MNKDKDKRIFDAFGTEVVVGDWIYFAGHYQSQMFVARVCGFTKIGNPYYDIFSSWDFVHSGKINKLSTKTCCQRAFVKCYNQPLIQTLENLIIENGIHR